MMKNILTTIKQNTAFENLNATTLWVAFVLSMMMLFKVLGLANVGLDLTDEGYYFNWISNPWLYQYYVSQFGYIYHPIYKLCGDSIVQLRQSNMLISYGLSWMLGYVVLREYFKAASNTLLVITSASLALPSLYILMITGKWVPSPSYNSLNFQGCLVAALGFVFSLKQESKYQFLAMLFIGLGGWLVFMAKPSTALLLSVVAVLFYIQNIKKDWRILLGASLVSVCLLLLSAFIIDDSVSQFIKRYQGGLQLMKAMNSGYGLNSLFKLDLFTLSTQFKLKLITLTMIMYFGFVVANGQSTPKKTIISFILFGILTLAISHVFQQKLNPENIPGYHTLILSALVFSSLIYLVVKQKPITLSSSYKLIILFLVLPYLFAVGTGNNYWQTAAGAIVFWVFATILILAKTPINLQMLCIVCCLTASVGTINLLDSLKSPYRQNEPILKQNTSYLDPRTQKQLILSSHTTKYLKTLNKVLNKTNFKPNTPVIDLTGHHPGTLYFMQAKAIGQAWTIGSYAGSAQLAVKALYQASCQELASAWLLIEKDGARALPEQILEQHGLIISKQQYQTVAKLETQPINVWNQNRIATFMQYLVKPIDIPNQAKACIAYRKTHTNPFDQL